jgi:hypothetical protein
MLNVKFCIKLLYKCLIIVLCFKRTFLFDGLNNKQVLRKDKMTFSMASGLGKLINRLLV